MITPALRGEKNKLANKVTVFGANAAKLAKLSDAVKRCASIKPFAERATSPVRIFFILLALRFNGLYLVVDLEQFCLKLKEVVYVVCRTSTDVGPRSFQDAEVVFGEEQEGTTRGRWRSCGSWEARSVR